MHYDNIQTCTGTALLFSLLCMQTYSHMCGKEHVFFRRVFIFLCIRYRFRNFAEFVSISCSFLIFLCIFLELSFFLSFFSLSVYLLLLFSPSLSPLLGCLPLSFFCVPLLHFILLYFLTFLNPAPPLFGALLFFTSSFHFLLSFSTVPSRALFPPLSHFPPSLSHSLPPSANGQQMYFRLLSAEALCYNVGLFLVVHALHFSVIYDGFHEFM